METPLGDFDSGTSDVEADYEPIITAPGNDADDPLDTVIAGCVFPVDEFQQVSDGLNRHQNWTVYPAARQGLQAAIAITSNGDIAAEKRCAPEPTASGRGRAPRTHPRPRPPPAWTSASRLPPSRFRRPARHLPPSPRHPRSSKELRQLYRDLIPNTLEKCITHDLNDWPDRIRRHPPRVGAVSRTRRAQARPGVARPNGRRRRRGRHPLSPPGSRVDLRRGRRVPSQARAGHPPEIRPRQGGRRRRIERRRAQDVFGAVVRVVDSPTTTIEQTDGRRRRPRRWGHMHRG